MLLQSDQGASKSNNDAVPWKAVKPQPGKKYWNTYLILFNFGVLSLSCFKDIVYLTVQCRNLISVIGTLPHGEKMKSLILYVTDLIKNVHRYL